MKRYRVIGGDFDTRAWLLDLDIKSEWTPDVRARWEENKANVRRGLEEQYGTIGHDAKVKNFADFGALPFSVIAYHNRFLRQVRDAFTIGAYYPALTGAAALGERILNHLMIRLRHDYIGTSEYKTVHNKDSFQEWETALDVLETWVVLLPDALDPFRKLSVLRNREAIHFNPNVDTDDRDPALRAGHLICQIVQAQFSSVGQQPWYISDTPGVTFVRRDAEQEPFVREFILPSCVLVGPEHRIVKFEPPIVEIADRDNYPDKDLTDEEFVIEWIRAKSQGSSRGAD